MALLEPSWKKTNVFELLFVKDFCDTFKNLLIEIFNVHTVIVMHALHWTLTKEIAGFIIVFWHFLLIETQQANVSMIFAVID
jgi:hypothetical protein